MPRAAFWSGWILFAGIIMLLIGAYNVLQGLAAIFSDDYFTVSEDDLLVFDFTAWGWIMLIWGAVLLLVGYGLVTGKPWARWAGIVVAGGHEGQALQVARQRRGVGVRPQRSQPSLVEAHPRADVAERGRVQDNPRVQALAALHVGHDAQHRVLEGAPSSGGHARPPRRSPGAPRAGG